MVEIKFCGLTRAVDADEAERLGARYLGVIFAGGPRNLEDTQARAVLTNCRHSNRVGVFASTNLDDLRRTAGQASLDILQIHAEAHPSTIERLRDTTGLEVWPVLRLAGAELPASAASIFAVAKTVVLDTRVAGALGGTGKSFDWPGAAVALEAIRGDTRVVVAGGLTPENVVDAIVALAPDVVDVSSGVESSPGVKDHERMAGFASAVRLAATAAR